MTPDPAATPVQELPSLDLEAGLSEESLALAFTQRHRDQLRYVHEWGAWLRWDDTRWAVERTLHVFDLARALTRDVAPTVKPHRLAAKITSAATVAAIVTLARVDRAHARVSEDFDQNPWLLNTPAGTITLRTGACRPHDRADHLTKVTPVAPDDREAPRWRACLTTWTDGNQDLAAFLQRLSGYWLTGSTKEEQFTILHGVGGNGKTKFIETLRACLGPDYCTSLAMDTLLMTHNDQHPTDLADLRGKRLAIASETEEGRHLAEAKLKTLTGGDRLRARHMRRDFFEFQPTHKIVIVGNHRPVLRNVDEAMRRRLILIPFPVVIAPEDKDLDLADKLLDERPAILRWMINGCLAWQAEGLRPPDGVRVATEEYFETADAVGQWLAECCLIAPNATMTKAAAFKSWKDWADTRGEFVGTERRLTERIRRAHGDLDETQQGTNRARTWIGVGLLSERV